MSLLYVWNRSIFVWFIFCRKYHFTSVPIAAKWSKRRKEGTTIYRNQLNCEIKILVALIGVTTEAWSSVLIRLVPHVDKAPLPLRIWRLVTSNFLQVENPTHPTAHAPERASVYILGQFRTPKREMNMYWKLRRFAVLSFRYKAFQILLLLVISILIIFSMWFILMWTFVSVQIAQVVAL